MSQSSPTVAPSPGILLTCAGQAGSALRWDARAACWRWSDPQGGQLYAWPPAPVSLAAPSAPSAPSAPAAASAASAPSAPSASRLLENATVMACCDSGRMLLGLGKRLGIVELPQADNVRPLQAQVLATIDAAEPRTRISDGRTDRHGNFVFGTANTGADQRPIGSFYQYSQRHGLRRLALPVVVTAASICFSRDGSRMYFADATRSAIWQCDYDSERARVGAVTQFVQASDGAGAAVVDSDGHLWSAQGGALVQYDSDGRQRQSIPVAPETVASLAFGGAVLDQLSALTAHGSLYAVPPVLAVGLAPGLADTLFDDSAAGDAAVVLSQRRHHSD